MTKKVSDLIDLLNEIRINQGWFSASFPQIIHKDDIDLSGYDERDSSCKGVDREYVDQSLFGGYGLMAIPFNDHFIVFRYCE